MPDRGCGRQFRIQGDSAAIFASEFVDGPPKRKHTHRVTGPKPVYFADRVRLRPSRGSGGRAHLWARAIFAQLKDSPVVEDPREASSDEERFHLIRD
jgi:hypothetical protein